MKACDRCLPKYVPVVETFVMQVDGSVIDVCNKCKSEILQFIHKPPPTKKKKSTGARLRKQNSTRVDA